jgi:hypothetical protein
MPNPALPEEPARPCCAMTKALCIDVEAHDRVLAVLVGALGRLAGGSEALDAAREEIQRVEDSLVSLDQDRLASPMASEFIDAWKKP